MAKNTSSGLKPESSKSESLEGIVYEACLPYPGLRPFLCDEHNDESTIFFGRTRPVDEIIDRLAKSHLIVVVGPSGCGKSSLIRAGVIPGLETGLNSKVGYRWRTAKMLPGADPLNAVAHAFESVCQTPDSLVGIKLLIQEAENGFSSVLDEYPSISDNSKSNLLLLIDQFEEVFAAQHDNSDLRDRFIRLILDHYENPHSKLYVIITMRSEFIGDCAKYSGFAEALNRTHYITPVLNEDELRDAVTRPAKLFGGSVETELVDKLISDVGVDSQYDPDHLPLVQHALMWMWIQAKRKRTGSAPGKVLAADGSTVQKSGIKLTLEDYTQLGGLKGALDNHIADILNSDLMKSEPGGANAGNDANTGNDNVVLRSFVCTR